MFSQIAAKSVWAALFLVAVVLGCLTALAITGHVSGDAVVGVAAGIIGGGVAVAGTHVGGNLVTAAAPPADPQAQPAGNVSSGVLTPVPKVGGTP